MRKHVALALLTAAGLWVATGAGAPPAEKDAGAAPAQGADGPAVKLETGKLEEADAKEKVGEPHYGYVGQLGTFEAAVSKTPSGKEPGAAFVVHNYPNQDQYALGCTKLKYVGAKRLGNLDGWVFQTEWDGKAYPSKVFLSAQRVYFGGGESAYIAADYREGTGWAWKLHALRRMELAKGEGLASGNR